MKLHGANASTFSDWWGYKEEVREAIPYNAAILLKSESIPPSIQMMPKWREDSIRKLGNW